MPADIADNLTDVNNGWTSKCSRLSVMRVEQKCVLNASTMSTGDSTLKVLKRMKFVIRMTWATNEI